jgi:anti-sigma factor RsiW
MNSDALITEADLHAFVDGQLPEQRAHEVEKYLASRPEEAQRVASYRAHKRELRALFDPVLDEALPLRLRRAARPHAPWFAQRLAAGLAVAVVSGAAGWALRGELPGARGDAPVMRQGTGDMSLAAASPFAQRAAVAHAVYSPDARRPVEVDAAHEDQLVAWLSKRLGAPMKPPRLQAMGYELEGGRLLPGGQGPVAQFMYRDASGAKLTLYVSNEIGDLSGARSTGGGNTESAFRFAQQGDLNVFYWVDGPFGYALSAQADKQLLTRVSEIVYRQLTPAR